MRSLTAWLTGTSRAAEAAMELVAARYTSPHAQLQRAARMYLRNWSAALRPLAEWAQRVQDAYAGTRGR